MTASADRSRAEPPHSIDSPVQVHPLPDLPTPGQRLSYARRLAGLSQTAAAKRIGRTRGVIVDIEADRREPRPEYLDVLAGAYSVPVEWLRGDPGQWSRGGRSPRNESPEAVRWIVDVATYERVMASESIDQLRPILGHDRAELLTIALPVSGSRMVDWREALAMQDAARAKLRALLEAEAEQGD